MSQGRSLFLKNDSENILIPNKKRVLLGKSETADLRLDFEGVEEIHALIEFSEKEITVYSLSPNNKIKINDNETVKGQINFGDLLTVGTVSFNFGEGDKPQKPLPLRPVFFEDEQRTRDNNYPLAALESEGYRAYIFEEDEIFPIFKYEVNKSAAEVIILYKGKILSVDYIGKQDGDYFLSGKSNKLNHIEFSYLGKKESLLLLKVQNGEFYVEDLPGFEHTNFSDNSTNILDKNDIHQFYKEDIQIFIKGDEAPPKVAPAPIFRRDKDFKKYLLICLLLVLAFLTGASLYEVDEEIEKEKAPERIATILYKKPKKMKVIKKKTLTQNKKKVNKRQKAPSTNPESGKKKPKVTKNSAGKLTSKKTGKVRKGKAVKGPTNKKKVVTGKKPKGQASKRAKTSKTRTKNRRVKNRGKVDTYKSFDFQSSLSSLMKKGGSTASIKNAKGRNE